LDALQFNRPQTLRADVTNDVDADAMVWTAVARFGRLDILVNNAGVLGPPSTLEETTVAAFDSMFAVNVKGVFLGSRAALPHFRKQRAGVNHQSSAASGLTSKVPNSLLVPVLSGASDASKPK
jgi:NAD(P)-dependent dehydrogenase (short-subunit alcohol dehydrogenase family)